MRLSFKNHIKIAVSSAIIAFGFSINASAQTVITGALSSDAGEYAPIVLGDAVNLNGCGSTFNAAGTPIANLCDSPTVNDISFTWFIQNDATNAFSVFTGAVLSLASGGVGDFFNAVGTYTVNLNVGANTAFTDLGGGFGFRDIDLGSGNTGRIFGSSIDNDSTAFTISTVTSVPEPESLLLLVPALLMIGRRQRRLMGLGKGVK